MMSKYNMSLKRYQQAMVLCLSLFIVSSTVLRNKVEICHQGPNFNSFRRELGCTKTKLDGTVVFSPK
uniref:Uncharacterized protein n=1 Tax=Lepeophtheirus salmonis TaxID=72036 RepID=A0A0K2UG00_LEPSM